MSGIFRSPVQTCMVCSRSVQVVPDGRGFPPDIAARKLAKLCKQAGHKSDPQYSAGLGIPERYEGQSS